MGTTILLVSHSGGTVVSLCDRAILLDRGELLCIGSPKDVVSRYQKLLYAPEDRRAAIREQIKLGTVSLARDVEAEAGAPGDRRSRSVASGEQDEFFDPELRPQSTIAYESRGAIIDSTRILNTAGKSVNCLRRGGRYRFAYEVRFESAATSVRFGMLIKTLSGVELGGVVSASGLQNAIPIVAPGARFRAEFGFDCMLNPGIYFLNAGVVGVDNGEERFLHRVLDVCMFRVLPEANPVTTGIVDFNCVPTTAVAVPQAPKVLS